MLLDTQHRNFFYRTKRASFIVPAYQKQLCKGIQDLLAQDLQNDELRRRCQNGPRGSHFPCIMGHAQQYRSVRPH